MAGETARYDPSAMLPAHRAFVVHFSTTRRPRSRFSDRAEHLGSGTAAHFASLRALPAFFAQLLDGPRDP
jgi:hypothetical protein